MREESEVKIIKTCQSEVNEPGLVTVRGDHIFIIKSLYELTGYRNYQGLARFLSLINHGVTWTIKILKQDQLFLFL